MREPHYWTFSQIFPKGLLRNKNGSDLRFHDGSSQLPATNHNNITKMPTTLSFGSSSASTLTVTRRFRSSFRLRPGDCFVTACLPQPPPPRSKTRLYVDGLSFRTTEEGLRNAFQDFGQLVDVNQVMDRIANKRRGFAFLLYAIEEESQKAILKECMGRVIFVENAKPREQNFVRALNKTQDKI